MINNFRFHSILIFILCPLLVCQGQTVKQITNIDGLSNNSVNCFFQDSQNTLWIGTWDGLNSYDARNIKTYRYNSNNENSLSNNIVRNILEDKRNNIWIATDYGINKWNRLSQKFQRYFVSDKVPVPSFEKTFFISIDESGSVYCAIKEQGIYKYIEEVDSFELINNSFYGLSFKNFFIHNTTLYLHLDSGEIQAFQIQADKLLEISSVLKVADQIFFSNNRILYVKDNTIYLLGKESYNIACDKHLTVSQVILQGPFLYFSYYNGGGYRYNIETGKVALLEGIDPQTAIFTLYSNTPNLLWIGTDGQGILQLHDSKSNFKTIYTKFPVRTFCENTKQELVVGTKGGGILIFNKQNKQLNFVSQIDKGLTSNSVYCLSKNTRGDIFVGTEGGINILHSDMHLTKLNFKSTDPYFTAIYSIIFTNNDSIMWLGTSGYGLIRVNISFKANEYRIDSVKQFTSSQSKSISNNIIYSIVSDQTKGCIWFGSRGGGLNKFDIQKNVFEHILQKEELSNNDVLCLKFDKNKNLWVGTSYGLNKLSPDGRIVSFYDNKELINNTIHGILEDGNENIWVSTNKGLSVIDRNDQVLRNYNYSDGLQNNEFSDGAYYLDSENKLYFGGVSGFNYFDPLDLKTRTYEPTIYLSSLSIDNSDYNIYEKIKNNTLNLSYNEGLVSLNFIADEFINNQNCKYAYRLKGFSDHWIELEIPNITTQFSPGSYKLEVKCTNSDKIWSNKIYTLAIVVANPWWLSLPAYLVYVLLLTIIVYVTQSIIRNRIRLNKQLLMEHLERKHQKQMNEAKLNFFTNIAHEFFTPLSLIYGPVQYLLGYSNPNDFTKKYLQIIKNNTERLRKLIEELMEFRKIEEGVLPLMPEYIDVLAFADYLSNNYFELAKENNINYLVEKKNLSTLYTDKSGLEKIVFNLFSNAFKYTPKEGYIRVKFEQESNKDLLITISNSGRGFSEQQQKEIYTRYKIFNTPKSREYTSTGIGLNFTKDLVALLRGTIRLKSEYGKYASFEVFIPSLPEEVENISTSATIVSENRITSPLKNIKANNILIVDDEAHIRELLKDILIPYYEINEASNGIEAIKLIQQNSPDLIISDILMPYMDGIALLEELKKSEFTAHIPVINISAKTSIEDHIQAIENGADLYITKPFHPQYILTSIQSLLQKKEALKKFFSSVYASLKVENGIPLHIEDKTFIKEMSEYIRKNIDNENLSADNIAEALALSKAVLYRKMKELTDKTPNEFVRNIRLEYAAHLLKTTKLTVMEIMYKVGFSNKSYFFREFGKQYGLTPGEYRK